MNINDIFEGKMEEGFLLRGNDRPSAMSAEQRVALIRKGNEFFNQGHFSVAKRIFLTTGYGDGLIRIGDYHYKRGEILEAFRMFWLAKEKTRTNVLAEKMAFVIREWLNMETDKKEQENESR